ncbi:MAG: DUF1592 domain-containing protein [Opitutales bacterium]|jgi:hypothetical protein|nr:DUF1592 domain-containing protein [Opitutales bacterium]
MRGVFRFSISLLVAVSSLLVQANEQMPPFASEFVSEYCIGCHGEEKQKGDRRLDGMSADVFDESNLMMLEEALDMLNLGDMPPDEKKVKQPSSEETRRMIEWLTERLTVAEDHRVPVSTVMRRLNRFEYVNTLRDLLGVHTESVDATFDFPQDPRVDGFDNNGESLVLSDYQLRRYLEVADLFLSKAIWFESKKPQPQKLRFTAPDFNGVTPESRTRAPVTWRINFDDKYMDIGHGQPVERHTNYPVKFSQTGVPEDGYYKIVVRAEAINRLDHPYSDSDFKMDFSEPLKMGLVIAPEPRLLQKNAHEGRRDVAIFDLADEVPTDYEATVWLEKGSTPFFHWSNGVSSKGTITKVAAKYHPEVVRTKDYLLQEGLAETKNLDSKTIGQVYEGPRVRVYSMELTGPVYESWPPKSHQLLFGKEMKPAKVAIDKTLRAFGSRAFRRPQTQEDVQHYADFVRHQKKLGKTDEAALKLGLSAILSSPKFLYLDEGDESESVELDDYQLASRLSYFLWSSMPDDELIELAGSGHLGSSEILGAQVDRMLKDKKAKAFIEHFTDGWLRINTLGSMLPDEKAFESYYSQRLEHAMREETRRYFGNLLVGNGSILDLLDSDYTFLNGPLAKHYGFKGINGETFRRVSLPKNSHRGGLLGHASVLTVTANGVETSPVVRGVWILENILGTPPSPPPPDVEPLEPDTRGATTIREQLKKHRNVQACADCHAKIDPLGFALEFYDPIGGYRNRYPGPGTQNKQIAGKRIDGSGELPSGESFKDESGLKKSLMARKGRFTQTLTEKLLVYGTGREMTYRDHEEIAGIAMELAESGYGLRDLVVAVASSEVFAKR